MEFSEGGWKRGKSSRGEIGEEREKFQRGLEKGNWGTGLKKGGKELSWREIF
jgi:hypothetical protein